MDLKLYIHYFESNSPINTMRQKSWGEYKKSVLDKLIERFRTFVISKNIKEDSVVLDLGCGFNGSFLTSLSKKIKRGVGLDISISSDNLSKNITLIKGKADRNIELKSNQFDIVTALALIEHVDNPEKMLKEVYRLLKRGGSLLITTPSKYSKPILEIMAFKLKLISGKEISDHKRYYDRKTLYKALAKSGFNNKNIGVKYFGLGLNIFAKATK